MTPNPLDTAALVGTIDLRIETGIPILPDIEVLHEKELRLPLSALVRLAERQGLGKLPSGASAKLNLGGLSAILELIRRIKELIDGIHAGSGGSGSGSGSGDHGPAPAPPDPDLPLPDLPGGPADPYPDGVKLVAVDASHPNHPDGPCPILDNTIHPPASWGTTNFDDGTHFVLHVGYTLKGEDLWFPEGSRLDRTSQLQFIPSWGARSAMLDAGVNDGAGFMADGGQIRKRYDDTRGMDPTVKFKPAAEGGPSHGQVVVLNLYAPSGPGTLVLSTYTFAPFQ